jgi:hypothetical protein
VVLFTNADIYFDNSLQFIKFDRNYAYCLTRTNEIISNGQLIYRHETYGYNFPIWGCDSWILKTPIIVSDVDFCMGVLGCDPVLAFRFLESGYLPINPSFLIKCYHLHNSLSRTWTEKDKLIGNYLSIKSLNEIKYLPENLYKANIKLVNDKFIDTEIDENIGLKFEL